MCRCKNRPTKGRACVLDFGALVDAGGRRSCVLPLPLPHAAPGMHPSAYTPQQAFPHVTALLGGKGGCPSSGVPPEGAHSGQADTPSALDGACRSAGGPVTAAVLPAACRRHCRCRCRCCRCRQLHNVRLLPHLPPTPHAAGERQPQRRPLRHSQRLAPCHRLPHPAPGPPATARPRCWQEGRA